MLREKEIHSRQLKVESGASFTAELAPILFLILSLFAFNFKLSTVNLFHAEPS
jgi:hypothetical protein